MIARFWKDTQSAAVADGWTVLLDGRQVHTPGRAPLLLPTAALAEAIATEWRAVAGKVDPATMPLTGLANAAIDHVARDPARFVAEAAAYADSDLLCYRADGPAALAARESAAWDPLLGWAAQRYDLSFEVVAGVVHRPQPVATLARLTEAVAALDPFALAALGRIVALTGTLVGALALAKRHVDAPALWDAAIVDEIWQVEQWREDAEAAAHRAARRDEMLVAARFLALCPGR